MDRGKARTLKLQLNNDLYLHEAELSATEERITVAVAKGFPEFPPDWEESAF